MGILTLYNAVHTLFFLNAKHLKSDLLCPSVHVSPISSVLLLWPQPASSFALLSILIF